MYRSMEAQEGEFASASTARQGGMLSRSGNECEFPEANTFTTTALDGAEPLPDDAPIPGSNSATAFITNCTNNAFNKLAKYYGLTDASIWYTAGLILNPAVKFKYLKYQWKDQPQWYEDARTAVKRLWQLQYKPREPPKSQGTKRSQPNRGTQPAKSVKREGNFRDSTLFAWKNEADADDDRDVPRYDEYEQYLHKKMYWNSMTPISQSQQLTTGRLSNHAGQILHDSPSTLYPYLRCPQSASAASAVAGT